MRLIVDERPSPVPERLHGRSAARSWRRRDAEGRTSAATRQRWVRGERTDPMALSSRKGQFTVKWDEGAERWENRDNGPVLHSVSHGEGKLGIIETYLVRVMVTGVVIRLPSGARWRVMRCDRCKYLSDLTQKLRRFDRGQLQCPWPQLRPHPAQRGRGHGAAAAGTARPSARRSAKEADWV